jgi:hypothetical protein
MPVSHATDAILGGWVGRAESGRFFGKKLRKKLL